ncbi:MAG: lamin tail domain-containing protein [Salibacteraceae bacterium]
MVKKFTLALVTMLTIGLTSQAQWLITTTGVANDTITFDASFTGVNNGVFAGTGLDATPGVGLLNSNAWLFNGFSTGNTTYGGTFTSGDHAKGGSSGGEFSGGLYAFEIAAGDTALGIQGTGSDFTPGDLELKVINTTGNAVDSVFIGYDLYVNNDADRGNTFNLSYSINGAAFVPVTALDFTSTELSQGSVMWVNNPKSAGINVTMANNDTIIFQWASDDAIGGGGRDEFALDNIVVNMSPAAPVSSDTTKPEVVDGNFHSATSVTVVFSEPVDATTATDVNNYAITPGITISGAVQSASLDSVTLTLSPALANGTQYTVNIMNVADTSGNANVMDPFTTDFYFNDYSGSDLMITEIMYAQNSAGVQDIDYFEIHNMGTSAVFLGGMDITRGMDLSIDSNLSIAAGDYFVFTEDVDSFMVAFPTVTNVMGVDGGSLSGGGEWIELSNTLGQSVVAVEYDNGAPWPGYSDIESIELCDLSTDFTDGANWYYAGTVSSTVANMIYGTPGAANSCAALPIISTYDIATVRTVDTDFVLDSLGVYCALEGIVHGKNLFGGGYSFTIHDGTAGINVVSFSNIGSFTVNQGDEVRVVGEIDQYNGLAQIQIDSVTVISTGNCIDFPTPTFELGEETESEPISLIQVRMADPADWPAAGSNANIDIVTMDGDTLTMRIDKDTEIADTITSGPSGLFNVSGIGGQFDSSTPHDEGYQIFPMFVSDFDTVPSTVSDLFVNEVMVDNQTVVADPQGDFDSWIEIYNANSTPMDLTGLLFGTEDPFYFSRCAAPIVVPAMGFTMLWADGDMADGAEHLPLELLDADFLGFATKDLTILDTVEWDSSLADVSYGRSVDGAGVWVSFETSTPNASNVDGVVLSVINAVATNPIVVYPNPVTEGNINFNKVVSFTMYSITGQVVMVQNNINRLDVSGLENGIYIIETTEGEIVKVIVK